MTMEKVNKAELFGNINFNTLAQDTDFKEDSVREVIILESTLKRLYTNLQIYIA